MAKIANAKYHENQAFAVLRTPDSGAKEFGEGDNFPYFTGPTGESWCDVFHLIPSETLG